jgi:hypothetical protein
MNKGVAEAAPFFRPDFQNSAFREYAGDAMSRVSWQPNCRPPQNSGTEVSIVNEYAEVSHVICT